VGNGKFVFTIGVILRSCGQKINLKN